MIGTWAWVSLILSWCPLHSLLMNTLEDYFSACFLYSSPAFYNVIIKVKLRRKEPQLG